METQQNITDLVSCLETVAAAAAAVKAAAPAEDGGTSGDRHNGSVDSTVTRSGSFSAAPVPPSFERPQHCAAESPDLSPQGPLPMENGTLVPNAGVSIIVPDCGPEKPPLDVTMPSVETLSIDDNVSYLTNPNLASTVDAPNVTDGLTASSCVVGENEDDSGDIDRLDEYIRSPEVQNAIVERSPGGRYVRFMEKLGSGASKDVFRAYDTQEGIEVAWNVVNLSGVPKSERNRIVNEVRLLERLHHPNIISFHGSWVNRERQEVNFVTEILSSGTLKSFINKVQLIRWKIAKRWATQILKGLEYLHLQDPPVIHRDLKAENIFINGTSGDLRIGDLGLSTVHRNGRVLSVLGTPEFMAPDMYEEGSYDVKVDIYAFGMVMLEIFTKEIPYSECMNPAQIYKKVSAGEPPEVLKRLQSRHAREFVKLCLGYKDDTGKYIRPSATELLKHAFLEIREGLDDEEVRVRPPLRENTILESSHESSTSSRVTTPSTSRPSVTEVSWAKHQSGGDHVPKPGANTPPAQSQKNLVSSLDSEDEDTDHFGEMPESETNMKKVKVLMGRGRELGDGALDTKPELIMTNMEKSNSISTSRGTEDSSLSKPYLVAAAVLGPLEPDTRPYPDDYLKLVVTLPVEGQTQHVQFDFHLIEDDPVQVAKEMVQELDIPQDAILEISQTISGLARTARMQVEAYNVKLGGGLSAVSVQHNLHGQSLVALQSQEMVRPALIDGHQSDINTSNASPLIADYSGQLVAAISTQQSVTKGPVHTQEHHSISYHNDSSFSQPPFQVPLQHEPPSAAVQMQQTQKYPTSQAHLGHRTQLPQQSGLQMPTTAPSIVPQQQAVAQQQPSHMHAPFQHAQHQQSQQRIQQVHVLHGPVAQIQSSMQNQQQFPPTSVSQQQMMPPHPSLCTSQQQPQEHRHSLPGDSQNHLMSRLHQTTHQVPPKAANSQVRSQAQGAALIYASQTHLSAPAAADSESLGYIVPQEPVSTLPKDMRTHSLVTDQPAIVLPSLSQAGVECLSKIPGSMAQNECEQASSLQQHDCLNAGQLLVERNRSASPIRIQDAAHDVAASLPTVIDGTSRESLNGSQDGDIDSEASDAEIEEELRKLEEDFKKNLQRTRKVFDSRMESLQRTLLERECQHQKTLEKHEKEKLEFEKRLAQEEEQQNRRLEQLQREWERKRKELAQNRRRVHEEEVNATSDASRHASIQMPSTVESSSDRSREGSAANTTEEGQIA